MTVMPKKPKASPCAVIYKMHEHRRSQINATSCSLFGHNIYQEKVLLLVIFFLLKPSDIYCTVFMGYFSQAAWKVGFRGGAEKIAR